MIITLKPVRETNTVYSNFDHKLDTAIVAELEADSGLCAQHAAWNFCGYVWRDLNGVWRNEVWQWRTPVEVIEGESVLDIIQAANERYGDA